MRNFIKLIEDYNRDVYHATRHDFDEFKPNRGVVYTSTTPDGAQRGASAANGEIGRKTGSGGDMRIMPLKIRGAIAGKDAPPCIKWPKSFQGSDGYYNERLGKLFKKKLESWTAPGLTEAGLRFARHILVTYLEYAYNGINGDILPQKEIENNIRHSWRMADGYHLSWENLEGGPYAKEYVPDDYYAGTELIEIPPHGKSSEKTSYQDALKALGYAGAVVHDEGGETIAMLHPNHIRSRFAKFDKTKSDSSNIMD